MADTATPIEPSTPAEPEPQLGEHPAPAGTQTGDEPFDADRAKAKIAKANAEAKSLRDRLRKAEEAERKLAEIEEASKTETERQAERLQQLQQENEQLRASQLRAQVAARKGVPAELLSGSTEEDLEASADQLLAFRGQPQPADFGAGSRGEPAGLKQLTKADLESMTPQQITEARSNGQLDNLLNPNR